MIDIDAAFVAELARYWRRSADAHLVLTDLDASDMERETAIILDEYARELRERAELKRRAA